MNQGKNNKQNRKFSKLNKIETKCDYLWDSVTAILSWKFIELNAVWDKNKNS